MHFPIIPNRRVWYTISLVLSLASIASIFAFGLNLSLQFTGGTENTYTFETRPDVNALRDFVVAEAKKHNDAQTEASTKIDIGTPVVLPLGDKGATLRYRIADGNKNQAYADFNVKLREAMESQYKATEMSTSSISPSVGNTMKTQAIWATVIASVLIVIYIAWGFRNLPKGLKPWVFGMNAIVALIHDLLIMTGIFVVLGYFFHVEIGPFFITALLTILGYSVNDTIVIYDRIRENLLKDKRGNLAKVAEESVWDTMARSINTSMTVVITLLCLLFLGAESIQMFVLALLIGVVVGTYSSIFIAAPLLVTFKAQEVSKKK